MTSNSVDRAYIVMGVAGCGKTTVGETLAVALGAPFAEGDAFHPAANVDKMSRGIALTDEDRWPWLDLYSAELKRNEGTVVGACSALKRAYRDRIRQGVKKPVTFVYLKGDKELISARMGAREGHFMPLSLLESQFAALEEPAADESVICVSVAGSADEIVAAAMNEIKKRAET